MLPILAEEQVPKLFAETREAAWGGRWVSSKQKAAGCSTAGKKAVSPALLEEEN